MPDFQQTFYIEDENGNRTPLERMTRAQCETVIQAMAEEIAYWRRLDDAVKGLLAAEDASGATIQ